jgi:predicted nucleic acid-binding protein
VAQILVDTDILIDVANNDATAKTRLTLESQESSLMVSAVTIMELVVGCRNKSEVQTLNRFLSKFQKMEITSQISDRATQLMQEYFLSHGLLIADALIAATAIENEIPLLTKNQSDFRFIKALHLLSYP